MKLGQIIKLERNKKGWTQKELSSGICAVSYLSLIETGKIIPDAVITTFLLEKLGVDKEYLSITNQNSIHNHLNEWYEAIRKRDNEISILLNTNFKKNFSQEIYDPTLQNHYLCVLLRHKVLHNELSGLNNILESLGKLESFLDKSSLIFYNHTLGHYEYECGNPNTSLCLLKSAKLLSESQNIKEPDLYYHLALTYLKLEDPANLLISTHLALNEYQLEVNPMRIIDCNILMGIANSKVGNFDEAKRNYENLLTSNLSTEQRGKVLHNLGHLFYKMGHFDKAVSTLKDAIKSKKGNLSLALSYYLLSKIYFEINDIASAKEIIQLGQILLGNIKSESLRVKYKLLERQIETPKPNGEFIEYLLEKAIPYFEEHEVDYAKKYLVKVASYFEEKRCYKEANYYLRKALKL